MKLVHLSRKSAKTWREKKNETDRKKDKEIEQIYKWKKRKEEKVDHSQKQARKEEKNDRKMKEWRQ